MAKNVSNNNNNKNNDSKRNIECCWATRVKKYADKWERERERAESDVVLLIRKFFADVILLLCLLLLKK